MTETDWLSLVIVLICLLLSAFFAGSETALTASSRASMMRLEKHGNKRAAIVNRLLTQRERLLGALLFGNNAVNIAASVLATGRIADLVRSCRLALCYGGDDHHCCRVFRDFTENRRLQRLRSHRSRRRPADVLVRHAVRSAADRDRGAGALAADADRHEGRRQSRHFIGARGIARRRRFAASGGRRRDARPRHVRRRARSARSSGLRRDDPPHQHDHLERRRFAGRPGQCRDRLAGDATAALARQSGKHRRHPARQGSAARACMRWTATPARSISPR